MKRAVVLLVALSVGCASGRHTHVLVAYTRAEPLQQAGVEVVNDTGRNLPMPPPGLIEQAVRAISGRPETESGIADAFARAATDRLATLKVSAGTGMSNDRLQIRLTAWEVNNSGAAGAVVFVSADYQLLDPRGTVVWRVEQQSLPVRLDGPNLTRNEVERVAAACVALALDSLTHAGSGAQ